MPFLCLSDPWVSVKLHNKQHSSENAQVQVIHQKWIKNQVMAKKNFERPSDSLLLKSHLKTLLEILAP